jgi:hypothetical protein
MGKGGGSGLSPDPRFHTTYMTGVPTIGAYAHIYIYVTKFVLNMVCTYVPIRAGLKHYICYVIKCVRLSFARGLIRCTGFQRSNDFYA